MAVKDKIKARLKIKYPKANLSTTRLDEISDKLSKKLTDESDDDAIDTSLSDANDLMDFEAMAKADDRMRTLEKKAKEIEDKSSGSGNDDDKGDDDDKSKNPDPNKALLDAINGLKTEIQEIKTGKITETKKQAAEKLFKDSEVLKGLKPELQQSWLNRIDVNSETALDEQVKALETEYTEIVQTSANSQEYAGQAARGGGEVKFSEAEAEKIVANIL